MQKYKRRTWRGQIRPIGLRLRQGIKSKFKFRRRRKIGPKQIFKTALYCLACLLIFSVLAFAYFSKDLPNPNKLSDRDIAQSTRIYDRDNKLLYSFHGEENRTVVKSGEIADYVKKATVAIEDKHFYQHSGIDVGGVFKAIARKVLGRRSQLAGGSTITQQYIKNALLSNERSLSRKVKELILSLEIEQIYSKDEILTGYLNQIPYGNNAYGIETAAKTYFDKSAKDLTLSEAAFLAAIPQAPSYYLAHKDDLVARKNHILDRMLALGIISEKDLALAKKAPPNNQTNIAANISNIKAPHFVFYVRDQLIDLLGGGQEAEIKLSTTGFKVQTTLDSSLQKIAEESVAEYQDKLKGFGASNAGLVAVDPKTGQILAMVGSVDFSNPEFGSFNVTDASRQPGSSFKPIVYATGFKEKFTPAFTLWDVPTRLDPAKNEIWPHNYDRSSSGPLTVRQAIQWSLNVPAVKMLALVGLPKALQTAKDLGITTLTNEKDYGLSLVLGAGEVKLIELVGAYSTFANQGKFNQVTPILKIEDARGKTIKEYKDESKSALDPQVAYQITHVLSDDGIRSTRWGKTALRLSNRHNVAAKTGTTSSFKDAWTVGYTTQLAAGVWAGNNNAKPMKTGADGLFIAAPIWNTFMTDALANKGWPDESFPRPNGIKEIKVDKWSGKLPTDQTPPDAIVTEILTSWQVPTTNDDVHVKVKIDKTTGKLATNDTPAEFIEEKYFTVIHSEMPSRSNWEDPVRAWAAAHGLTDLPPTEYDNIHTNDNKPLPQFKTPIDGENVSGQITLTASVSGPYRTNDVEYFIDNASIGKSTEDSYRLTYNTNQLATGKHIIKIKALNEIGLSGETTITVNVNNDLFPPADVSSISATAGVGSVTLQWLNPPDIDLDYVVIYYSTESGKIGTKYSPNTSASAGSTSSIKISGLQSNKQYYFIIHPVDKYGNENQSAKQVLSTPL